MINIKGSKLIISFHYDPELVSAVKSIPGRAYNNSAKHWEVPVEHVADVMALSDRFHLRMHRDVELLARDREKEVKKVEMLKATPTVYTGSLPLYDYQKIGASFMMSMPGSLLADAPGLGKTLQTIAACEKERKILIVAPKSLLHSWKAELHKWDRDVKVYVSDGNRNERNDIYETARSEKGKFYLIVGYESARIDIEELQKF